MESVHQAQRSSSRAAKTPSDSSSSPPPPASPPSPAPPPPSPSSSSSPPSSAASSPPRSPQAPAARSERQPVGRDLVPDRCRPACRGLTPCRAGLQANNHTQLGHPPGGGIKEEPRDEIKDYAETTMNELLGWYGYNDVIHEEDTLNLDLKRFAPNGERPPSCLDRSRANSPGDAASQRAKDGLISATDSRGRAEKFVGGSNSLASKNETIVAALSIGGKTIKDELKKTSPAIDSREASSDGNTPDSDGAAPCESAQSLTCAWCQKRAGEKPLSFEMDDGLTKVFCTDLCFTLCRRASFKKSKVCDWCKKVKNTVSYVDFQDGEQQLQFCGEQCLNQYKMNIFCKETQSIKSQLGSVIVPPPDGTKQIIITPDLWTEQQQQQQQQEQQQQQQRRRLEDENRQNETRDSARSSSSRSVGDGQSPRGSREEKDACKRLGHCQKVKTRAELSGEKRYGDGHPPYKNGKLRYDVGVNGESDRLPAQRTPGNIPRSPKRESALYASASGHRPSSKNAADGHQQKSGVATGQERLKFNHSADGFVYPPYSLTTTSPSPRSTASTAPPGGVPLHTTSGLAGGQLLGCLGPAGVQPWMYGPLLASGMAGFPGFGLPGLQLRQPGSSLSMASPPPAPPAPPAPPPPPGLPIVVPEKRDAECSQTPASQPQPAPQPPRLPFAGGSLPPNAPSLFGMLPPPPGMPGLLGMGGPGLVPPIGGNLNGLLPPNTLMVPYPVVVPLPIPLPLPIPIPVPCDKSGNPMLPVQVPRTESSPLIQTAQIKREDPDVGPTSLYPEGARIATSTPYRIDADSERTSCANTGVDRILCACCNRKPAEGQQGHRDTLRTDTPPPLHSRHSPSHVTRARAATSSQNVQNDVIDLSKDRKRKFDGDFDVNRNNAATSTLTSTLTMSPPSSSSSESESSSQLTLAAAITVRHPVESVYSARRSLILDAPSLPKNRHRESPTLDKRLYVAGLSKEHTYGKRRCIRPRIRTK